ncbi:glycerophosphodiester phosphodiesterase family protein [Granulosicoccaceae sp. 1_MG-2023]|nr:glycerophosphodiester phosphodiesterase family protein [Granulosicoccaceae sp. 1_MG-2023]
MTLIEKLAQGQLICAHRGHRACFPENSLSAFADCAGRCDLVEFDVHFSADGVPVVFHDETPGRTTNILEIPGMAGRAGEPLSEFSLLELQQLDNSSWFYREDPFGQLRAGKTRLPADTRQSICTLDEVLGLLSGFGLGINIEVKSLHRDTDHSIATLVELIGAAGLHEDCVVSAFDHTILRSLKSADPAIAVAPLVDDWIPRNTTDYLRELGASGLHVEDRQATPELLRELTDAGYYLAVYTVNDAERKRELLDWGVGAVITDFL